MLKQVITALLLTLAMACASAGKMTLLEEAVEFETLDLRIPSKGNAVLQMQACDECEPVKLTVTLSASLNVSGKNLPMSAANGRTLRTGTVFYRPDTGMVTRIEAAR